MAALETAFALGFPPVFRHDCRVLILGSLPGVRSIETQQYYGHARNGFWTIMQRLLGVDATASYEARCRALIESRVGLWDMLAASVRPGSLDSAIDMSTAQPNDVRSLLHEGGDIRAVAFNGRKAAQLFGRYCGDHDNATRSIDLLTLPSTSPAHAAMSLHEKTREWSLLKRHLTAI